LVRADIRSALAHARAALERAERADEPRTLALAVVSYAETRALQITPGLVERGIAIEECLERPLPFWQSPTAVLGDRFGLAGDVDRARAVFERIEKTAAGRGDEATRLTVLGQLILVEWLAGRPQQALEHSAVARELAEQARDERTLRIVLMLEAIVEVQLGLVESARAKAEEGLAIAQAEGEEWFAIINRSTLGHLELALGNLAAADRHLRDLPPRLLALGYEDPGGPAWTESIETLVGLGELELARSYLGRYEELARRAGAPAQAGAAHCRGLLLAAEGDLHAAIDSLRRALAVNEELHLPFFCGRTLLSLGSALRQARQKRAAREALEEALTIFEDLGARLWAENARAELRRVSGRRPASEALTETEKRVAGLAVDGLANKVIAAALYMSVHTVEAHLTHVYRKLGIRSRGQLAAKLSATR
jgi:ATP/maltotriose-dependent transcriptional regulator MalT